MFNYIGILKTNMSSNFKSNVNKMWKRPAAYYELLNQRWRTTKSETINGILTLFAETTRMPQSYCSSFSPKLLREKQTLSDCYQIIPTNGTFYFSICLRWRYSGYLYRLPELSANQNRNTCLVRFGVNLCPVYGYG